MRNSALNVVMAGLGVFGIAEAAHAAEILVVADIAVSETWTSDNTYNLQTQIFVLPGATLTIEAGTVIASDTDPLKGGSLAVCNGAQIFVNGTRENPVIFTSKNDTSTWTAGDPRTGTWREAANEWGNLTIMGDAYISENAIVSNTPDPDPANVANMEGLLAGFPGDTKVQYGGGNDDYDAGSLTYLSIRYGGKIVAFATELNGLSLGGIGRDTDLHHVEIMNNVDDGIEIWGGTLDIHHFSIWNIGDDSFDVDQGWRGKAQFGLIVQGYSVDANQGSGVGDNCFETDGAEQSDYQPVTTACIYNCTVIGQPVDGDHGTAFRDNARVQYRNCIFMDLGERLVSFDNIDGDGGAGYAANGTLDWPTTWLTAYDAVPAHANDPATPSDFYQAQSSGNLIELSDCVFFRNLHASAYTEANAQTVDDPAMNNVTIPGFADVDSPVTTLTRGGAVVRGGKTMLPVTFLDPRPANEALTSVDVAPNDGFFDSVRYRGAFAPEMNWLCGWTASQAFGFTPDDCAWSDLGNALDGVNGDPELSGVGDLTDSSPVSLNLRNARANAPCFLIIGLFANNLPYKGGVVVPSFDLLFPLATDGAGELLQNSTWPTGIPSGTSLYFQYLIADQAGVKKMSFSNAVAGTTP